jgi:hypothetical protein
MRNFIIYFHKILLGSRIRKDEMGRACCTHGGDEKCIQTFSRQTWMEETTWEKGIEGITLSNLDVGVWIGFIRLMTVSSWGLL